MEWFTALPWVLQAIITVLGVLVCLALLGPALGSIFIAGGLGIVAIGTIGATAVWLVITPIGWFMRKTGISKALHQCRMRNIAVQEELRYKQRVAGRELTETEKKAVRKDTETKWNERYAR